MAHIFSSQQNRKSVILITSIIMSITCASLASAAPLKVACNLPLSGPRATYGQAVLKGIEMAQVDLRNSGKALVSYDFEDNQSDPKTSVTVLNRQLQQSPDIYVSGVKPEYMAIETRIKNAGIPHFPWVFDINLRPKGEMNYRTWVNFKIEPAVFVQYARKVAAQSIVILRADLPIYDEEYHQHIIPQIEAAGLKINAEIIYPIDKTDFKDLATRVKALKADFYILAGFQENLVGMIKAFNRLNLISEGNTIITYDLLDAAPLMAPSEIEGIRVVAPKFLIDGVSDRYQSWKQEFMKRNSRPPLYTHAYAYDMALVLNEAALLWDGDSRDSLIQSMNAVDIEGVSGWLKFNTSGDLSYEVVRGVYRGGTLVSDD